MSSILDALKKLEAEKAEAVSPSQGFREETALEELTGHTPLKTRLTFRVTPGLLVAIVTGVLLLVVTSVVASIVVMRSAVHSVRAAETIVQTAALPAPPVAQPPAEPGPEPLAPIAASPSLRNPVEEPPGAAPEPAMPGVSERNGHAYREQPVPAQGEPGLVPRQVRPPAAAPEPSPPASVSALRTSHPPGGAARVPEPERSAAEKPDAGLQNGEMQGAPDEEEFRSDPYASVEAGSPSRRAPKDVAPPADAYEPPPEGSVSVFSLPVLTNTVRDEYGLKDMKVNMVRPAGKNRPYASAIINLQTVHVGELVPGTRARLIAVEPRGVALEMDGAGARYHVRF